MCTDAAKVLPGSHMCVLWVHGALTLLVSLLASRRTQQGGQCNRRFRNGRPGPLADPANEPGLVAAIHVYILALSLQRLHIVPARSVSLVCTAVVLLLVSQSFISL